MLKKNTASTLTKEQLVFMTWHHSWTLNKVMVYPPSTLCRLCKTTVLALKLAFVLQQQRAVLI